MNSLLKKTDKFLFYYDFKKPFGFFRIAIALYSIIFFICIAGDMQNLIGLNGYTGREITEALISSRFIPRISWFANVLIKAELSDEKAITVILCTYFISMILMLAGLFTRISTFAVWLIHLMICNSNHFFFSYGVDAFTNIALLYCLIMPTGRYWSLDNLLFKKRKKYPSEYESFFIRMLQIHLCIAYFFEGLFKLIEPGWITGDNMFITLISPRFNVADFSFIIYHPFIAKITGWIIVALELFYPVMMYFSKSRKLWLICIILMHAFIAIFMKLPFFGLMMIILNVTAFGWDKLYSLLSNRFKSPVIQKNQL